MFMPINNVQYQILYLFIYLFLYGILVLVTCYKNPVYTELHILFSFYISVYAT